MALLRYPYTNLHELNLDWIIEQLNKNGPVLSVNEKTGMVTLTGEDITRSTNNPETVATALNSQGQSIQTVRTQIGVTPLPTVAQTLTGAIAENAQEIANIEDDVIGDTELPTEAQTLTGAIAENADNIDGNAQSITNINNKIGNTSLPTTAQTLTGAIAENTNDISALSSQLQTINFQYRFENLGVGTGAIQTVNVPNPPAGKTLQMCTVNQSSGLNLVPVWISTISRGSNTVTVQVYNARTSATDVTVEIFALYW